MDDLPISYRLSKSDDLPFVYAAWLSDCHTTYRHCPNNLYNSEMRRKCQFLLARSITMVAYLDDEPDTILGYLVYQFHNDTVIVHHSFVKSPFRDYNISTKLLELTNILKLPVVITYDGKLPNAVYDAFYFERNFYNET